MRHAQLVTCDFCGASIDTSKAWSAIQAVVPEDVAADVAEQWRQQFPPGAAVLGLDRQVQAPTHCHVDVCRGCEEAKLPDLRAVVAVMVLTQLEKHRDRAARQHARPRLGGES